MAMTRVRIEGLPHQASKGELVRWLAETAQVSGSRVGRIERSGNAATVELPEHEVGRLLSKLDGAMFQTRRVRVRLDAGGSELRNSHARGGEDWFAQLRQWLEWEAEAEREQIESQSSAREGTSLRNLAIRSDDVGLGGRLLLSLGKPDPHKPLPPHAFQPGSPVLLRVDSADAPPGIRGIIAQRTPAALTVAVDVPEDGLPDGDRWRLDLAYDEVARQRQLAALDRARLARAERLAELREVLLGEREPVVGPEPEVVFFNTGLNPSQQAAVKQALAAKDVAIVHGPPGTGKTTVLVEIIRQAVARGESVLACAPSNLAVDHLLESVIRKGIAAVRLGHPARVSPELHDSTLDELAQHHPDRVQARKLVRQAFALLKQAGKWTRAKPQPGERAAMRQEARQLLGDARALERRAIERILDGAKLIGATLTGVDADTMGQRVFDWVILDEACQATEPACWIPILRAKKVVLGGDHCQLPPTVLSDAASKAGLIVSMMERLVDRFGPLITRRLNIQYRMNQAIMQFSAQEFYDGDLHADASVAEHRLVDLPAVAADAMTEMPVRFLDTAGASFEEEPEPDGPSRRNPQEARQIVAQVRALIDHGVPAGEIAVIAPYNAQVRLLREQLRDIDGLEVDSVDGFQGREKEAVLVTLVRSNSEGEIGFLGDIRRTNVAMTRARRRLFLIGDSATLAQHPFYQRMVEYLESIGAYGSIWEEMA
ncbi:AAA domain-containing protein [Tuwongella immobilis]|uniref:DNA helicase n=1 Tax=Tuwongella immobilis TaxID=692036 RepID=A0A6C2YW22_9BACT|nr:AAA domain-containing protein [Tuwongella immobilis]VIP05095.1 DNA-binding protein OS=Blastopirellula marina DSM 3645 GN=DSM3645_25482 PE=4 SV=1: DbpA: AAA_11: AAA_12 [Tuwongella immobilis]VTS07546.1 DNA-binding protein OS=Blastopirellula marina DSM 3645 GN=DSM3645_25482 PE=4 SV=1: DbpA: AAA_11: AAA_12 [Tuwongella immobilis]